ncbi:hypothetical protein HG537_0C03590 [Torulaspora globosa]|uniref:Auxin efflux carrier n=1 Tax=Torulaspora globosa TaxID=48254 RepID=A0A7H9HR09_9SACH|nr:hypothetical protein HG537_0C03590 [Torulaspora sp. CBS 2947]
MSVPLGPVIWASFKPIIKIYLIIGTGFMLARMGILSVETTRSISDLVLTVLLPCLSFNKIVANIEGKDIKTVGIICLSSVILFATGFFFAYVVRRTMPVPRQWYGGILAGGMFPNISDLPIAYLQTMDQGFLFTEEEGEKGVACVIIFLAMFLICVFNLGGFRLVESDFHYKDEESAVHDIEDDMEPSEQALSTESSSDTGPKETMPKPEKAVTKHSGSNSEGNSEESLPTSVLDGQSPSRASLSTQTGQNVDQNYPDAPMMRNQPIAYTEENQLSHRLSRSSSVVTTVRSIDLRDGPPQNINNLIREYSNVDQYGHPRRSSLTSYVDGASLRHSLRGLPSAEENRNSTLTKILTSDATVSKHDIEASGGSLPKWLKKIPLTSFVVFFLKNCLRPCSMAVILALIVAFIPWVKALFVTTESTPKLSQAPDNAPALSFLMDFTGYLGAASVPFGLLLLGATLGRLKIGKLYPGFWKSAVVLVILKMCVMPIFGVLWCDRLVKAGWVNWEDDKMLLFVIAIDWGLPTMTTLIYFTASYTPPDAEDTTQIECTSFFLMIQYPVMAVSLPFLVSYFLKVQMKV